MTMRPLILALSALALLAGCDRRADDGPVAVSVIGADTRLRDPVRTTLRPADAALIGAIAQGLVRFDAEGQIMAGLAIRWAISDDGLYYTFRLDRERSDAESIATALRRHVLHQRKGPLDVKFDAVREIVAVTPEVIEIRLSAPRPDLLTLLAQPAFGLLVEGKGSGPLAVEGQVGRLTTLVAPKLAEVEGEDVVQPQPILLRGERVALAIARFKSGESRLVTGGGFDDLPYVKLAAVPPEQLQIDPASGLFGLRIIGRGSFLDEVDNRQALSMALDRDAIGDAFGIIGWRSEQAILPAGLGDVVQPRRPFWAQALANVRSRGQAQANTVDTARGIVARWRERHGGATPSLRVALPDGVGSAILFATLRQQWAAIGVRIRRVRLSDPADLKLIDEVAPSDQADWFLRHFLCDRGPPCSRAADTAYTSAMSAAAPAERIRMMREAEDHLDAVTPFIPIAQPVRWSLATPGLTGFRTNSRAIHPLAALIIR